MIAETSDSPESHPVFLVCEQGSPLHIAAMDRLEYCFSEAEPGQVFSAWQVSDSNQGSGDDATQSSLFEVAIASRELTGGFAQQALNRPVAAALMRTGVSALVVSGVWGCTIDLPRIADMLGIATVFVIPDTQELPEHLDASTVVWLKDAFRRCRFIAANDLPQALQPLVAPEKLVSPAALPGIVEGLSHEGHATRTFNYSTYEFLSRDHPLLHAMQYRDVRFFQGSERVLDVACGAGIFLDCLRKAGIEAVGVERDSMIAGYGVGMGLDIVNQDAMEYLNTTTDRFDGIYCSHFIEHLPIEVVQELIGLLYQRLAPGGLLVLVFPDPESIRSQLLGFWPPTLISMDSPPQAPAGPAGWLDTLFARFGLQSRRRAESSEEMWRNWAKQAATALDSQRSYLEHLKQRSDKLWQVNATWSWNDNATILLRRSEDRDSPLP